MLYFMMIQYPAWQLKIATLLMGTIFSGLLCVKAGGYIFEKGARAKECGKQKPTRLQVQVAT